MYAELHAHSAFSFLDGASLPDELAATAVELGYDALALTDHNAVCGSMEFAQAAAAVGLKAIHGAEVDVCGERPSGRARGQEEGRTRHLTLLVESRRGWRSLCHILTRAHAHTRVWPEPRASSPPPSRHDRLHSRRTALGRPSDIPPMVDLDFVLAHAEGLVCLSGCAERGVRDEPALRRLREAFGPEALRVELQRPFGRHDRARNRMLAQLARRIGVPTIATGNVHTHARSRAPLQDAFVALRNHTSLDASEPLRRGNFAHVLASPAAMEARFEDHPDAVREARALADRLSFDLTEDLGYRYPGSEDDEALRRLTELCWTLFDGRYPHGDPHRAEAHGRLEQELRVIDSLGLAGFFILHRDLLELAREVAAEVRGPSTVRALLPPGRGRGSSVSSIVCYLTGLSHIDPIKNRLFLGRFLNEELTALPDIDLDFPRDVREVLIPRVHERYGRERSALVAAFPTFKARGAIRELGKALGLPPGEIERVARGAEPWQEHAVEEDIAVGIGRGKGGRWAWLARLCDEAWGLPRHLSQHSGGMIVSTHPLVDCCPVIPAAMEGRQLCQWDKDSCADAGFLKIDLLGLGMLSAVERCVESIAVSRGERVDLSRIPFDDPATFEAIRDADTMGVFQIESRAQMASLHRTRPENLDDLTIQVAIVRPGPILGGAVNPYIARRQRVREDPDYVVPYEHPSLEPVLADTLGAIIFQDQVLEVAIAFAGFSPGVAEGLRRAMSRKRSAAALEAFRVRFLEGARRTHGADEELAQRVWSMIQGFSGFGFPKAHGAAFGLLAYQSTWLRVHYGPEFLCSLLNEQPMGFYPSDTLSHEAQRRGIEVVGPAVDASEVACTVEAPPSPEAPGGRVRIGLGYLNGARTEDMAAVVAARREGGPFASLADLASRAGVGRPALEVLAWSGACDGLAGVDELALPAAAAAPAPAAAAPASSPAPTSLAAARIDRARRIALWRLGMTAPGRATGEGVQLSLPLETPEAPALRPLAPWEAMVADYATTGLTLGAHPLALLRPSLPEGTVSVRDLERLRHDTPVRIGGLVVARQRPGTAKGIVFMLLEDEFGTINLIVPPPVYEAHRLIVRSEPLILAEGRLEKLPMAGGAINVYVHRVRALDAPHGAVADVVDLAARTVAAAAAEGPDRAHAPAATAMAAAGEDRPDIADFRGVAPAVQSFASGRRR